MCEGSPSVHSGARFLRQTVLDSKLEDSLLALLPGSTKDLTTMLVMKFWCYQFHPEVWGP